NGVFEERAAEELPLLVVAELLVQRPADSLGDTAAHLSLDEGGVERTPDVLRDRVAEELDLTRIAVYPGMDEMSGSRGRRARLRGSGGRRAGRRAPAVSFDRAVLPAPRERLARELLHGERAVRRADGADDSVDDLEVVGRDLELLGRDLEQLATDLLGRALHRS